jgi:uncharacterized protein YlxP (DUF503 family)
MHVSSLVVRLRLDGCAGRRERRRRVEALLETLHRHFNAAIAELGRADACDEVILAAATVAESRREARATLDRLADALACHPDATLITPAEFHDH